MSGNKRRAPRFAALRPELGDDYRRLTGAMAKSGTALNVMAREVKF